MPYHRRMSIRERLVHRRNEQIYEANRALRDEFGPITPARWKKAFAEVALGDDISNWASKNLTVLGQAPRQRSVCDPAHDERPSPWAQIDDDDLNKVVEIWKRQGGR